MANGGSAVGAYTGRPRFQLQIAVSIYTYDTANNRSMWNWSLSILNLDNSTLTWQGGVAGWISATVGGQLVLDTPPADGMYDFRDGAASHMLANGRTGWLYHNSNGDLTVTMSGGAQGAGIFGDASAVGSFAANRIVKPATVPSKPARPTLHSRSDTAIGWSFVNPANGGATITDWDHQIATNSSFTSGVQTFKDANTPASRGGLTPGVTYYIRSRAINSVGASAWSDTLQVATLATPPSAPGTPSISGTSPSSISYTWSTPSDTGGTPITGYEFQYSRNSSMSGATTQQLDVSLGPSSHTVGGLEPGVTYYARVRAKNGAGLGPWSGVRSGSTDAVAPSRPPAPLLTSKTATSITFNRQSSSDDGGSNITTYQFQIATNSSFSGATSWTSNSLSQTRTGLTRATTYYVRARAQNGVGYSPWSPTMTVTTDRTVPSKPPAPTYSSRTPTSITFRRGTPSDNGGATISTYEFQAARNSGFTTGLISWSSGSTTQTASPLTPGTTYYIRYRARNAEGVSAWSDTLVQDSLTTGNPRLSVAAAASGTSAALTITPPSGGTPDSYRIERRISGSTAVTTINTPLTTYISSPLTPGTTYQWRVSAFFGSYQTGWSSWVTLQQPKPNTNPGDYFDGNTTNETDVQYVWTGTANNSISQARGRDVSNWSSSVIGSPSFPQPLVRVTGGRSGSYAARVVIDRDITQGELYVITPSDTFISVAELGIYWGSMYVRTSRTQSMRAMIIWYSESNAELGRVYGSPQVTGPNSWTRLTARGEAPEGATKARIRVHAYTSGANYSPWLAGEWILADDAMMTIGELLPWFSGNTRNTATAAYSWLGATNASVSMMSPLDPAETDPLADPDCPPIPGAPQPPRIEDSCIDEVGSWRRYWAIIPGDEVLDWLAIIPTISLTTGDLAARQVRIRFYSNPDNLDPDEAGALTEESQQTVSYIPPNAEFVLDGVSQRAWASVGGQDNLPASHLLYGQDGAPATWPTLTCGTPYLISFDVPLDAPAGNLEVGVALTTRMM